MNDKSALLEQLRLHRGDPAAQKPRSALRWLAAVAAALAVLALSAWLFFGRASGVPVRIALAQESPGGSAGSAASLLDASGYVVARREATVSSKITGKVLEVMIEEGQRVAANEVLARLDDSNARARLQQAGRADCASGGKSAGGPDCAQ
jgi:HlyD family secretion protein